VEGCQIRVAHVHAPATRQRRLALLRVTKSHAAFQHAAAHVQLPIVRQFNMHAAETLQRSVEHHVSIAVEMQKGSQCPNAVVHLAVKLDATFGSQIRGNQKARAVELPTIGRVSLRG
jgi:hypothetical protein